MYKFCSLSLSFLLYKKISKFQEKDFLSLRSEIIKIHSNDKGKILKRIITIPFFEFITRIKFGKRNSLKLKKCLEQDRCLINLYKNINVSNYKKIFVHLLSLSLDNKIYHQNTFNYYDFIIHIVNAYQVDASVFNDILGLFPGENKMFDNRLSQLLFNNTNFVNYGLEDICPISDDVDPLTENWLKLANYQRHIALILRSRFRYALNYKNLLNKIDTFALSNVVAEEEGVPPTLAHYYCDKSGFDKYLELRKFNEFKKLKYFFGKNILMNFYRLILEIIFYYSIKSSVNFNAGIKEDLILLILIYIFLVYGFIIDNFIVMFQNKKMAKNLGLCSKKIFPILNHMTTYKSGTAYLLLINNFGPSLHVKLSPKMIEGYSVLKILSVRTEEQEPEIVHYRNTGYNLWLSLIGTITSTDSGITTDNNTFTTFDDYNFMFNKIGFTPTLGESNSAEISMLQNFVVKDMFDVTVFVTENQITFVTDCSINKKNAITHCVASYFVYKQIYTSLRRSKRFDLLFSDYKARMKERVLKYKKGFGVASPLQIDFIVEENKVVKADLRRNEVSLFPSEDQIFSEGVLKMEESNRSMILETEPVYVKPIYVEKEPKIKKTQLLAKRIINKKGKLVRTKGSQRLERFLNRNKPAQFEEKEIISEDVKRERMESFYAQKESEFLQIKEAWTNRLKDIEDKISAEKRKIEAIKKGYNSVDMSEKYHHLLQRVFKKLKSKDLKISKTRKYLLSRLKKSRIWQDIKLKKDKRLPNTYTLKRYTYGIKRSKKGESKNVLSEVSRQICYLEDTLTKINKSMYQTCLFKFHKEKEILESNNTIDKEEILLNNENMTIFLFNVFYLLTGNVQTSYVQLSFFLNFHRLKRNGHSVRLRSIFFISA